MTNTIAKTGRTFAGILAATLVLGAGGIAVANAAEPTEPTAPTVEWVAPKVNGLAAEQEAEAAAAEAARIEAERVEAERVAAEAAEVARLEAERVAAEAAERARLEVEEAAKPKPAPVTPRSGPAPVAPVDGGGSKYNENTDSMDHTICEVTPEGVAIPCP